VRLLRLDAVSHEEESALSTPAPESRESLHRGTLLIVLLDDRHLSVVDLQPEVSQQRRRDISDRLLRRHIPLREEVDLPIIPPGRATTHANGAVALVFVLSLLLGACASSGSMRAGEGVLEFPPVTRTGVQPGNQVTIAFYTAAGMRLAEVSGERDVDSNGELFLPFLGTVSVVGLETAEIRKLLEDRYGVLYSNPVVEVVTRINVNITGAVRSPGQFYLPPSATLVDALARAGGVTSDVDLGIQGGASDASRVRLVRDGVATVIDLRPLDIRPEVMALQVQSGDWLFVPRAQGSQTREQITFWGSLLSTLLTAASLIVLIAR